MLENRTVLPDEYIEDIDWHEKSALDSSELNRYLLHNTWSFSGNICTE